MVLKFYTNAPGITYINYSLTCESVIHIEAAFTFEKTCCVRWQFYMYPCIYRYRASWLYEHPIRSIQVKPASVSCALVGIIAFSSSIIFIYFSPLNPCIFLIPLEDCLIMVTNFSTLLNNKVGKFFDVFVVPIKS